MAPTHTPFTARSETIASVPATKVDNAAALIALGEIERAARVLTAHQREWCADVTMSWIRIALERRNLGRAAELFGELNDPDDADARVLQGDLIVRTRRYDEHYDLVFAVVRTRRLENRQLGALALQTAELAVLNANHSLALELFEFASSLLREDPLLHGRNEVGRQLVGRLTGDGSRQRRTGTASSKAPGPAVAPSSVLGIAATSVAAIDTRSTVDDEAMEQLRDAADRLTEAGLVDLGRRLQIMMTALSERRPTGEFSPVDLAHCAWVTTDLLYHRFERCPDDEFDYWAAALEQRAASCPHSSLVTETSDVVRWARSIYDQHQQNVALDRAIEQTRSGWRELANLTSNEIRGLLTSLGVAADLRRSGSSTPVGLELALVHRIAALTTMTQLGASESPGEVERPPETGTSARDLLSEVVAGERPIFEWARRPVVFTNHVDADVMIRVNPSAMSDMLRWLLLSATTGSLSDASIEIIAGTAPPYPDGSGDFGGSGTSGIETVAAFEDDTEPRLTIEILSRTAAPPEPERHRELGLGSETTAYRAAVMLIQSWNGRFSAAYSAVGLDIVIELPIENQPRPPAADQMVRG